MPYPTSFLATLNIHQKQSSITNWEDGFLWNVTDKSLSAIVLLRNTYSRIIWTYWNRIFLFIRTDSFIKLPSFKNMGWCPKVFLWLVISQVITPLSSLQKNTTAVGTSSSLNAFFSIKIFFGSKLKRCQTRLFLIIKFLALVTQKVNIPYWKSSKKDKKMKR